MRRTAHRAAHLPKRRTAQRRPRYPGGPLPRRPLPTMLLHQGRDCHCRLLPRGHHAGAALISCLPLAAAYEAGAPPTAFPPRAGPYGRTRFRPSAQSPIAHKKLWLRCWRGTRQGAACAARAWRAAPEQSLIPCASTKAAQRARPENPRRQGCKERKRQLPPHAFPARPDAMTADSAAAWHRVGPATGPGLQNRGPAAMPQARYPHRPHSAGH